MTKPEMIRSIAVALPNHMHLSHAERIFDNLIGDLASALADKGELRLPGIGTLSLTRTAEKPGRNPRTGAAITIPAGARGKFRLGKTMKDRLAAASRTPAQRAE